MPKYVALLFAIAIATPMNCWLTGCDDSQSPAAQCTELLEYYCSRYEECRLTGTYYDCMEQAKTSLFGSFGSCDGVKGVNTTEHEECYDQITVATCEVLADHIPPICKAAFRTPY